LKALYFEDVKGQIGYCGIWCGSCAAGNGAIIELARGFDELVRKYELEKWVPKDFDFREFTKGLSSIQTMSVCPGCHKGGGSPECRIKVCASSKKIVDCSQCDQISKCTNFDNPTMKEELMKNSGVNREELIYKWTNELKTKWPHCALFLQNQG